MREVVLQILSYDPLTGVFPWKKNGKLAAIKFSDKRRDCLQILRGLAVSCPRVN